MAHQCLHLLEIEYVQAVLDAAFLALPLNVQEELRAAGVQCELNTSAEEGETSPGRFDLRGPTLLFFGPLVMATTVGQLKLLFARVAASAWLWLRKDIFWSHPNRIKLIAREWGFNDAESKADPQA